MEDRACRLLYFWVLAAWLSFALFMIFDWNHGLIRLALVVGVGALLWLYRRWTTTFAAIVNPSARWMRLAVLLLVVGALANLAVGGWFLRESARTGRVRSDQAQTVIDALQLLRRGVNPYGADTVTDRIGHEAALELLDSLPGCRTSAAPVRFRVGRADEAVVPGIRATSECETAGRLFASLGFKYGPVTLLLYWPFTAVFGPAGFVIAHLGLLVALALLLAQWPRRDRWHPFWTCTALLLLVWPIPLAWNTLRFEHLDLPPVYLALVGWRCCDRRRFSAAAIWFGLGLGAKFLPVLLYIPRLAAASVRVWAIVPAVALACFAPFAVWDWTGLWHNAAYPFLRPPDSTAAVFFLDARAAVLLRLAALLAAGGLALRAHRAGWHPRASLEYLLAAHLAMLASGTTFHNNYLLWLLSIVPLFMLLEEIEPVIDSRGATPGGP